MHARTSPCRILLVEDHADTRDVVARLLEKSGYSVATAGTCAAAVGLAKQERFGLLIADFLTAPVTSSYPG